MFKQVVGAAALAAALCLHLGAAPPVGAAGPTFSIEDAETRDPSVYYDERPSLIEVDRAMCTQGNRSIHFKTGTAKDSGNLTKYDWPKAADLTQYASNGNVHLDLWVKNPGDIGDSGYGRRIQVTLGSRSNNKYIVWYVGSRLLKAGSWNSVDLRIRDGKASVGGSTVNGVSIADDPESMVTNGDIDWKQISYNNFVVFVEKAPIEGYLDNWYVGPVAAPTCIRVPLSEIDDDSRRARAEKGGPWPTAEYDIIPPDVRKDAFFKDDVLRWDEGAKWSADFLNCESGRFCLSMDQAIRGKKNAKIEFKTKSSEAKVVLSPDKPIVLDRDFDTLDWWIHGNYHGGTEFAVNFLLPDGTIYRWAGGTADYRDPGLLFDSWQLAHAVLSKKLAKGTKIASFEFIPPKPGSYLFHIDQMRVVDIKALIASTKAPVYSHVKDKVKLPVSPNGACPTSAEKVETRTVISHGIGILSYVSKSGDRVEYRYKPETGTLSDLFVTMNGNPPFQPAFGSGPILEHGGRVVNSIKGECKAKLLSSRREGGSLVYTWRYASDLGSTDITYTFQMKGKTLAIGLKSSDSGVAEWYFGKAKGVRSAKVVEVPFMSCSPNVLVADGAFVTYYADWYKSNASRFATFGANEVKGDEAAYSFQDPGFEYRKRTDGSRHPFKECFYITMSSKFEDCLLNISNPPSPFKSVLKERLWRLSSRAFNSRYTDFVKLATDTVDLYDKYGMDKIYFTFHAPLWSYRASRGPEPWHSRMQTSITVPGGDPAIQNLFDHMKQLGIRPGYYSGCYFTEPISAIWDYNSAALNTDGSWSPVWVQSYHMKPWYFPELVNTFYTEQAKKFGPQVIYDDGWTSMHVWEANDYDHRVEGSGRYIDTLTAMATGWRDYRKLVDGPIFSEGNGRCYYTAGLNDGDYGKLKTYANGKSPEENRAPLLVDFELRKVLPLNSPVSIDIGYWGYSSSFAGPYSHDYKYMYPFLATQIAFGTIGMMEPYSVLHVDPKTDFDKTLAFYFMMQQLQKRYVMEHVEEINYFDGKTLVPTSEAVQRDVYQNNMVFISYKNGLKIWVNCNWDNKNWTIDDLGQSYVLPPGGWYARQGRDFIEYSALVDGRRVDFVDSPDYTYIDPHGKSITLAGLAADRITVHNKTGRQAGQTIRFPE